MKYHTPNRKEKTIINRALDRWGVFDYFRDKSLWLGKEKEGSASLCLLSNGLSSALEKSEAYSAGLVIGELKKQFTPTVPGAYLFAKVRNSTNMYYVSVNDRAEKLVLYGRDIMGDSIVEASSELDENKLVIILNEKKEGIGVGRTRFAGKYLFQAGKVTITTLYDAGMYLRNEG